MAPIESSELAWLLRAAAMGDDHAARRFVALTRPTIVRVCRVLGSGLDIDDLVGETYLRALTSSSGVDAVRSPLAWLASIARHVCIDEIRRVTRRRRLIDAMRPARSAEVTGASELAALIDELPDDRREAFLLTAVAGFSYDEVADLMGCPVGTVRSRVSRARAMLVAASEAADTEIGRAG